jgi:prepilin-type N-terminal cleavage/methylation domain-containing protein
MLALEKKAIGRAQPFRSRGFTLTEVLAVVVIIGILAVLAVPSGINIWARIQLEDAQNRVERALRTARTNARASLLGRAWVVGWTIQSQTCRLWLSRMRRASAMNLPPVSGYA